MFDWIGRIFRKIIQPNKRLIQKSTVLYFPFFSKSIVKFATTKAILLLQKFL